MYRLANEHGDELLEPWNGMYLKKYYADGFSVRLQKYLAYLVFVRNSLISLNLYITTYVRTLLENKQYNFIVALERIRRLEKPYEFLELYCES